LTLNSFTPNIESVCHCRQPVLYVQSEDLIAIGGETCDDSSNFYGVESRFQVSGCALVRKLSANEGNGTALSEWRITGSTFLRFLLPDSQEQAIHR